MSKARISGGCGEDLDSGVPLRGLRAIRKGGSARAQTPCTQRGVHVMSRGRGSCGTSHGPVKSGLWTARFMTLRSPRDGGSREGSTCSAGQLERRPHTAQAAGKDKACVSSICGERPSRRG